MLKVWKVTFLLVAIGILAGIPAVISAQTESGAGASKMYLAVSTTRTIQRANLDGSQLEELTRYIGPGRGGFSDIVLDVAAGKMYWSVHDADNDGSGRIQRANLDGSQMENLIAGSPGSRRPSGLALDVAAGKMYWGNTFRRDEGTSSIQRADLDGSQIEDLITSGLSWPRELDLDVAAGKMYWVDDGANKIQRANLDGSEVEDLVVTGLAGPLDIALDVAGGKMYWVDIETEKIQRANLDGSQIEDLVVAGLDAPISIALDVAAGKMYWTDVGTNKIQRANLDGSQVEDLTTSFTASAITLDVASVPATGQGTGTGDNCGQSVAADGTVSGSWASGCNSEARTGSHARYYSFTLERSSQVTVTLNSGAANTYLYIRSGDATSGAPLHENDDHQGSTSASQIQETLAAGTYTVEATTNTAGATGSFTLTITVGDLPTVHVSRAAGFENAAVRPGSPVSLTATFSRQVSGFTIDDITVENGTVSNFAGSGTVYTFDVTPDDIGEVTVEIPAGAAEYADGNGNPATLRFSLGITYDDNGDGDINRGEAIAAIRDYFSDRITRAQAIAVIRLYFSTPTEPEPGPGPQPGPGSIESDRAALVVLYNTAGGANWANNSSWTSDAPLGEWFGIETDDSGRVVRVDLQQNSLSGAIPGDLGNLTSLKWLFLNNHVISCQGTSCRATSPTANRLTGTIPPELGQLTNLESLYLGANPLTGEIPSELAGLVRLKRLGLFASQLSGEIPSSLGDLANLDMLLLDWNSFSGPIPVELGNLTKLTHLKLSVNQLTGTIPASLGNLTRLEHLGLNKNQLTGSIPASLGNLSNLNSMYISENELSGCIPVGLRRVPGNDFFELPFCSQ